MVSLEDKAGLRWAGGPHPHYPPQATQPMALGGLQQHMAPHR